jgi:DNA (cytosine-5)-methyltransferase 1
MFESPSRFRVAEYFAGIGLARLGLEQAGLKVVWSNDISEKKHQMYRRNFVEEDTGHTFEKGDLRTLAVSRMPTEVDLAWASSPCTDLSLAGSRAGLHKGASSAFWYFVRSLAAQRVQRPPVVVLENVSGFATSAAGKDIRTAIRALNGLGYSVDMLSIDARRFVPQSRPRLFLVGELNPVDDEPNENDLRPRNFETFYSDPTLRMHKRDLPKAPALLTKGFASIVDDVDDESSEWWGKDKSEAFQDSLSDTQLARLSSLRAEEAISYRTAFRRMRSGVARWEIRADDIAGCLRTAGGGSSRQAVVRVGSGDVRIRWMSPTEYARLMGAGEYQLREVGRTDAYSGFGDAVCVPVVRWLAHNYLVPALNHQVHERRTPTGSLLALAG